jgi:hypothetical protein
MLGVCLVVRNKLRRAIDGGSGLGLQEICPTK